MMREANVPAQSVCGCRVPLTAECRPEDAGFYWLNRTAHAMIANPTHKDANATWYAETLPFGPDHPFDQVGIKLVLPLILVIKLGHWH